MTTDAQAITHEPFFEALGSSEEGGSEWRAAVAGLAVLRFAERAGDGIAPSPWTVRALRAAVSDMDEGDPARAILEGIVNTLITNPSATISVVMPRLMAYARTLDHHGRWTLAADVYGMVAELAEVEHDAALRADARIRAGYCARMLGDFDRAARIYAEVERDATAELDLPLSLRARLAIGRVSVARGNLPHADAVFVAAANDARSHGLRSILGNALHERCVVAYRQGDFPQAVRFGHDALTHLDEPTARDRALADIATAFGSLQMYDAARDALLILAETAQEQVSRWTSLVNLLELAYLDGREPVFEQYRQQLAPLSLPPYIHAGYAMYAGRGCIAFGRIDEGRAMLREAIAIASQHKLNQIVFEAEKSLFEADIPRRANSEKKETSYKDASLQTVADSVAALRLQLTAAG